MTSSHLPLVCLLASLATPAFAQDAPADAAGAGAKSPPQDKAKPRVVELRHVVMRGRKLDLVGEAISASEGSIDREEIAARPWPAAATCSSSFQGWSPPQHAGSGKANQYFLRGFNLDHGTDFATFVDAMPVNMRTHGHGQG